MNVMYLDMFGEELGGNVGLWIAEPASGASAAAAAAHVAGTRGRGGDGNALVPVQSLPKTTHTVCIHQYQGAVW